MRYLAVALIVLTVLGGGCARNEGIPQVGEAQVTLALKRVVHTSCGDRSGWTNLFFEGNAGDTGGAVALFAELPNGAQIEVVQRETTAGLEYQLRSGAGGETLLQFVPTDDGFLCATAELQVQGDNRPTHVQIGLAEGYTYGRIAEHREGMLKTELGDRRVELYAASRAAVRFDQLSDLELFVDGEGRPAVRYQTTLDSLRGILHSDRVDGNAFLVGRERFRVDSVSDVGSRLFLGRMSESTAVARGFRAPSFGGHDLTGQQYVLNPAGRITVVEFWSIDCPFSEQARPEGNRLAAEVRAQGGEYVSMTREDDVAAISSFLAEHPREGSRLARDDATWTLWNPRTITPLYYVIGPDGTILLREAGASAVRLAAATAKGAARHEK